jgi:hypothetical protein
MTNEVQGKLIVKGETESFGANNFRVRKFVLELENERNPEYNQFRELQLTQDRVDMLNAHDLNSEVKVSFNLDGRAWEKDGVTKYFNQDSAWRIEKVGAAVENTATANSAGPLASALTEEEDGDGLPF